MLHRDNFDYIYVCRDMLYREGICYIGIMDMLNRDMLYGDMLYWDNGYVI